MERFRREVLLARRVSHPNVCRVYELYEARTAPGRAHPLPHHGAARGRVTGPPSCAGRTNDDGRGAPAGAADVRGAGGGPRRGGHPPGLQEQQRAARAAGGEGEGTTSSTRVVITDFGVARALDLASEDECGGGPVDRSGHPGDAGVHGPGAGDGCRGDGGQRHLRPGRRPVRDGDGEAALHGDTPLAAAARRLNEAPPRPETTVPGLDRRWAAAIVRCLARQPERRFRSARDVFPALDRPGEEAPRRASGCRRRCGSPPRRGVRHRQVPARAPAPRVWRRRPPSSCHDRR